MILEFDVLTSADLASLGLCLSVFLNDDLLRVGIRFVTALFLDGGFNEATLGCLVGDESFN